MKKFKFKIKGQNYDVEIKSFENDIAQIEVNGTVHTVNVEVIAEETQAKPVARKAAPVAEVKTAPASGLTPFKAPLPGEITQIRVKKGDTIKKGQTLFIMVAMKMENEILSETDGVIASIKVNEGDVVLQNDLILEIQ